MSPILVLSVAASAWQCFSVQAPVGDVVLEGPSLSMRSDLEAVTETKNATAPQAPTAPTAPQAQTPPSNPVREENVHVVGPLGFVFTLGSYKSQLFIVSACANLVLSLLLCLCCWLTWPASHHVPKEYHREQTHWEPIVCDEEDEMHLFQIERVAGSELFANVKKSPSKSSKSWLKGHKERFLAVVPMTDVASTGSALSRTNEWRRGFLGWWVSNAEFNDWCACARPAPKGSLPLQEIERVAVRRGAEVFVNYKLGGESTEMTMNFDKEEEAQKWVDGMGKLLKLLSTQKQGAGLHRTGGSRRSSLGQSRPRPSAASAGSAASSG